MDLETHFCFNLEKKIQKKLRIIVKTQLLWYVQIHFKSFKFQFIYIILGEFNSFKINFI